MLPEINAEGMPEKVIIQELTQINISLLTRNSQHRSKKKAKKILRVKIPEEFLVFEYFDFLCEPFLIVRVFYSSFLLCKIDFKIKSNQGRFSFLKH